MHVVATKDQALSEAVREFARELFGAVSRPTTDVDQG